MRKLAVEAADNGLLAPELASGITRVKGVASKGVRLGNWLSVQQAQTLLNTPDATTTKGLRDRAILAVLLGCGLRRSEVAAPTVGHVQQRDGRWCIVDLVGKHGRVRTIPMPTWVKVATDAWTTAAGVAKGYVFRPVNRTGQVQGAGLSEKVVWQLLQGYAAAAGVPGVATGAGALSVVAVRRPRQPRWRWSWCPVPGRSVSAGSPASSRAASLAGGSFCAGLRRPGPVRELAAAVAWLWSSTGLLFPALPLNSPTHGSSSRPATPATTLPQPPPQKKSTLEAPANLLPPLPRRESRVVLVAVHCEAAVLGGTAAKAVPLLPGRTPAPLGVGIVDSRTALPRAHTQLKASVTLAGDRHSLD